MRFGFTLLGCTTAALLCVSAFDSLSTAADIRKVDFEVSETAGIRRRNDVITIRSTRPELVGHNGGFRVSHAGTSIPAQVRRVEQPDQPPELVVDFIDHFQPFDTRNYFLELSKEPMTDEPAEGLKLTESDDAWQIDSSGLVLWTIRKDLAGLLDFSWKQTDYIADGSSGFYFTARDGTRSEFAQRPPTRAFIERSGPIAIGLGFEYDDWPPGAQSSVRLEFPRTKSWLHATWVIEGEPASLRTIGAELNLQLDGPEALLDFGAGDFVYTTVTAEQSAILDAGPRDGSTIPWDVWHGQKDEHDVIAAAPRDIATPRVHGWAHVMDDKRCTALAIADFGETTGDSIEVKGDGRLAWLRNYYDDRQPEMRRLEFWIHFVTMPVHIGARTSPRSMQEPLEVHWLAE